MRSSLPWELQCKSYLTISVYIMVFPPQPYFIIKLCSNVKNNLKILTMAAPKPNLMLTYSLGVFVDMHTKVLYTCEQVNNWDPAFSQHFVML